MHYVPVVIIGAGQAGLAMSHCLTQRRIEHVVLERGRIAERWRSERWDSLRLLTPNWMTRLPGWSYDGDDPDGYMTAPEFVRYLADYAGSSGAPIKAGTTVLSVRSTPFGYRVETNWFGWETRAVVIATGQCDVPRIPDFAQRLPAWLHQMTPSEYRNPASTSGRRRAGGRRICNGRAACGGDPAIRPGCRPLGGAPHAVAAALSGRDTWWWLERIGVLDEATDEVSDLQRARACPPSSLLGGPDGRTIDLGTLRDAGVRILGRAIGAEGNISASPRRPGRDHGRGTGSAGTPAGAHRHRR